MTAEENSPSGISLEKFERRSLFQMTRHITDSVGPIHADHGQLQSLALGAQVELSEVDPEETAICRALVIVDLVLCVGNGPPQSRRDIGCLDVDGFHGHGNGSDHSSRRCERRHRV